MASDTLQPQTQPPVSRQRSTQSPPTNILAAASAAAAAAVLPQTSSDAPYTVRLMAVVERLRRHFLGKNPLQTPELIRFYFALAKSIDYAISIGDVPQVAPHLPFIIKQVYQHRSSAVLSAIIFLVIAAKSACQNGWFPDAVADEILSMTKELIGGVCITPTPSETMASGSALDTISKLIERFYPQMKLCRLIISLEAKPGYDILMGDFHIKRDKSPEEKIRLFVVQKDNLETSSCVISPAHVSFLVNGKGVDGRTNCRMASGPQFPTDITRMLKYGANIIQAVGVFNSTYVIAVAHTLDIAPPAPALKDCVQPVARSVASDADVTEGPSRITLRCPISFRRIKTPVKGYQCKHHQCFDYDNFMQMNARRPFWRCPCCNQPVSFIDLRVDQGMIKILREVGEDANDVLIYADGSWNMLPKYEGNLDQSHKATAVQQNDDIESECNENTNTMANLVDLTTEDGNDVYQPEDTKPFKDSQALLNSDVLTPPAPIEPEATGLRSTCHQLGITIEPGVVSSSNGLPASARRPDASAGTLESLIPSVVMNPLGTNGSFANGFSTFSTGTYSNLLGTLESLVSSALMNPVTTDTVSLPHELQTAATMGIPKPTIFQQTPAGQNGASMQLQQAYRRNDSVNSTSQSSSIPKHPNAVQALSIQSGAPALDQATRYQVLGDQHHVRKPSAEQVIGTPINTSVSSAQLRGAGLHVAPSPSPSLFNSRVRPSQNVSANASLSQLLAMQAQQMLQNTSNLTNIQNHLLARMAQASRPQPVESVNLSTRRVTTPQPPELPPGQNWRPTGRMRGSLHGAAFDEAFSQYVTPPSQTGTPRQGN